MTTFEVKCYENDWRFLLLTGQIERLIKNCHHKFDTRQLVINNVNNYNAVSKAADKLVSRNVIDQYFLVKNYEKEVLEHFSLKKEDFKGGYYYSIAELTAIYLCKTKYLLHFSSDAMIERSSVDWIQEAINKMDNDPDILVGFPNYKEAKEESFHEDNFWYYGYGFTDQCYLVRSGDFQKNIYMEKNQYSERYPSYGGELFEKRVDAYMRNKNKYKISFKKVGYRHENFPKNKIERILKFQQMRIKNLWYSCVCFLSILSFIL